MIETDTALMVPASVASGADRLTFIRATEVWTLDASGTRLTLASGIYGKMDAFAAASGMESFGLGEGLPGKAWAEARPVVLKGFHGSYFKRTDAATAAGLTAGIAMPVFDGTDLKGVVVFLFGDDDVNVGAVEVWHAGDTTAGTMAQDDGYYGAAEHFEWISRHTRFPKSQGLPGKVWSSGGAVIFRDLGASFRFLRSESAAEAGLTAGLGLPVPSCAADDYVVTLLSARGTPIARRFEIWSPSEDGPGFKLSDGMTGDGTELVKLGGAPLVTLPGQGPIGQVIETGVPLALADLPPGSGTGEFAALTSGYTALVALPIYRDGALAQVAAWYF